ncbi:proliferating cell nuclear antigen (pcna) [Candidatus Woesearchaeota archaeon]|jgi:proliferating cell nuclear antigen|nr:proliferating cell nuclear antigen (pcna) [Candidatus Woesearchaeota archaeon]MBT7237890.1 proliferating cell nuclear antigen (pcna) [Candidatus Woesearchaeota archaeon]
MKFVLSEPKLLKDSVGVISDLVSDVKIKFDSDKLEIVAMDPANVAMVVFRLLSSSFVEYDVKEGESIILSLDSLKQVLGRSKASDSVIFELNEETNKLNIRFEGETKRNFNLSLLESVLGDQKVPELDFPGSVELNTFVFNDAIDDMDIISDSIILNLSREGLMMESVGNTSDAKANLSVKEDGNLVCSEDPIKSKYSIEYLKKIAKGGKLASNVVLKFGQDYPLQIEYKIQDKLSLTTILAPRVSND